MEDRRKMVVLDPLIPLVVEDKNILEFGGNKVVYRDQGVTTTLVRTPQQMEWIYKAINGLHIEEEIEDKVRKRIIEDCEKEQAANDKGYILPTTELPLEVELALERVRGLSGKYGYAVDYLYTEAKKCCEGSITVLNRLFQENELNLRMNMGVIFDNFKEGYLRLLNTEKARKEGLKYVREEQ